MWVSIHGKSTSGEYSLTAGVGVQCQAPPSYTGVNQGAFSRGTEQQGEMGLCRIWGGSLVPTCES